MDPEFAKAVRGLELCLKVRERERLRDSGIDSCRVLTADRLGLRSNSAGCGGGFAPVLVAHSAGGSGELDVSAVAPNAASAGDELLVGQCSCCACNGKVRVIESLDCLS